MKPITRLLLLLLLVLVCCILLLASGCRDRAKQNAGDEAAVDTTGQSAETGADTSDATTDRMPPVDEGVARSESDNMEVSAPGRGQKVSTEGFVLIGRARTFENALSYRLIDRSGTTLVEGHLTSVGEMGHLNPFTTEISVGSGYTGPATLEVFQYSANDGRPIDMVKVPIVLTHESREEQRELRVYFANARLNGNGDCGNVFSVQRPRGSTVAVAEAALRELLKGPTADEKAEGYSSEIPAGVTLRSIAIDHGVATADFSAGLNRVAGSCRVEAIHAQIERTLEQFPTVKRVVIAVEGDSDAALQP